VANVNTIKNQVSGPLQNMFSTTAFTYAANTSTETIFTLNAGAVSLAGGGVIPISLGNPNEYYGSSGPQQTAFTAGWVGRTFLVRVAGSVTAGSGMSITIKLYQITAAQIAAGTTTATSFATGTSNIATTGSLSVASVSTNFELQALLQLSSTGQLNGRQAGHVNTTAVAAATLTNTPTGLVGEADLNFFVTGAFSAGSSSGLIVINELAIEQI